MSKTKTIITILLKKKLIRYNDEYVKNNIEPRYC